MGIEPYCVKCRGRHFFNAACVSNAPVYQKVIDEGVRESWRVEPGGCSECLLLQKRIAELELKLARFNASRAKRNAYQKNYMKKRREAFPSDAVIALKLNTL